MSTEIAFHHGRWTLHNQPGHPGPGNPDQPETLSRRAEERRFSHEDTKGGAVTLLGGLLAGAPVRPAVEPEEDERRDEGGDGAGEEAGDVRVTVKRLSL